MMKIDIKELKGANMDIDLIPGAVHWKQDKCPWNQKENTEKYKCAVKNQSLCQYFCGMNYPDTILCSYPKKRH